jgi:membrane protein required for colicin V production
MLIDFAFVLVMCLAVFLGLKKGLIRAVVSFFSYLIAMILAIQFSSVLTTYLNKDAGEFQKWMPLVSFLAIFLTVIFLGGLLARILDKTSEVMMLGWLNKLGGMVLYLITYSLLFSALLFFANMMNWLERRQIEDSFFYPFLSGFAPQIMDVLGNIIPPLKNSFKNLEDFFGVYRG